MKEEDIPLLTFNNNVCDIGYTGGRHRENTRKRLIRDEIRKKNYEK